MIKLLSEEEATGKAKEILDEIKNTFGVVPNFFRAQATLDLDWFELNRNCKKRIMLSKGGTSLRSYGEKPYEGRDRRRD